VPPLLDAKNVTVPSLAGGAAGRAHLLGIGGSGMRALAEVLSGLGWLVTGSDAAREAVGELTAMGIQAVHGHAREHVSSDVNLVVHSDAIGPDNPELRAARQLGIPTLNYPQMLGRLMQGRRGLAVAGTHGKSTTTAMAAEILACAGLDPTVVLGATPLERATGGRAGRGEAVLVEACEYRANFRHLTPAVAVVLGIEPDHFDYYRSSAELEQAFADFAGRVPSAGLVLSRSGCPATRRAVRDLPARQETFGLEPEADWRAVEVRDVRGNCDFRVLCRGSHFLDIALRVPGRHNVLNALAATALAWECGVEAATIRQALAGFKGLKRRLEVLGTWRGVSVVDDYAHHPTEIAAALAAVRRMFPRRRLWCVFQPHQVSRTKYLLDEFAAVMDNADKIAVADIFRAREPDPQAGEVTAADLVRRIRRRGGDVLGGHALPEIFQRLRSALAPGDVLVTMGAGDIRKHCDDFIDRIQGDGSPERTPGAPHLAAPRRTDRVLRGAALG
jgi:UDP-N-acetylmuramate--alanine ligase